MQFVYKIGRVLGFVIATITLFFVIVMMEKVGKPLLLGQTPGSTPISFPAAFTFLLAVILMFRKIVLRKNSKSLLIAFFFYLACNAIGLVLFMVNEPIIATPFSWIGLVGIGLYYAVKPFKKPMVE